MLLGAASCKDDSRVGGGGGHARRGPCLGSLEAHWVEPLVEHRRPHEVNGAREYGPEPFLWQVRAPAATAAATVAGVESRMAARAMSKAPTTL